MFGTSIYTIADPTGLQSAQIDANCPFPLPVAKPKNLNFTVGVSFFGRPFRNSRPLRNGRRHPNSRREYKNKGLTVGNVRNNYVIRTIVHP